MFPVAELPLLFNGIYACPGLATTTAGIRNTQPSPTQFFTMYMNSLTFRSCRMRMRHFASARSSNPPHCPRNSEIENSKRIGAILTNLG